MPQMFSGIILYGVKVSWNEHNKNRMVNKRTIGTSRSYYSVEKQNRYIT